MTGDQPRPGVLFKADILARITEVADELAARNLHATLVVVGGAYLALRDLRDATVDVDSITRLTTAVKTVVAEVAHRHGLRDNWLNDGAAMFAPATFRIEDCSVFFSRSHLTVLGPPPNQVFVMKLFAARAPDHDDMIALWPLCSFDSAGAVIEAYAAAYPHEEHDPYLVDYVERVITAAR